MVRDTAGWVEAGIEGTECQNEIVWGSLARGIPRTPQETWSSIPSKRRARPVFPATRATPPMSLPSFSEPEMSTAPSPDSLNFQSPATSGFLPGTSGGGAGSGGFGTSGAGAATGSFGGSGAGAGGAGSVLGGSSGGFGAGACAMAFRASSLVDHSPR